MATRLPMFSEPQELPQTAICLPIPAKSEVAGVPRSDFPTMRWQGSAPALLFLLAVALLPGEAQGYFRGDPVQLFKRIQYEQKRTVWSDVLVGQAPMFAVDRAIDLHLPSQVTPPRGRYGGAPARVEWWSVMGALPLQVVFEEWRFVGVGCWTGMQPRAGSAVAGLSLLGITAGTVDFFSPPL